MKLSRDRVRMTFLGLRQSIKVINRLKRPWVWLTLREDCLFCHQSQYDPVISFISTFIVIVTNNTTGTSGSLLQSDWSRSQPGCDLRSWVCRPRQQVRQGSESGCRCLERWEECAAGRSVRVCTVWVFQLLRWVSGTADWWKNLYCSQWQYLAAIFVS